MKKKLLSVLLAGTMLLSMGVNVFAEETAKDSNVNEDGTVNNPEDVKVDKNKLVMWSLFTGGDGEYISKIIDDYNAGSPTKQVQPITLVWADYYTKLQTAVAADKGPDIGLSHASKLAELVDQGVVEPLDDYLDELGVDLSSMYSENSLDAVTFDGEIYAIPLDTHAEVFYYNTDILEKAGIELNSDGKLDIKSEDQFMDMLDKVKAVMGDGESPISLTNTGDDPYRVWWATYYQMGGTPIVNDDGTEVTLDKDIAVKAADFVKTLYDNGYIASGIDDHQKLFQAGKAGFMFTGTWAVGAMEQTEGLNFGVQSFPQLFDQDHCWADSHTFILPVKGERSEEDTKAAVEFMVSASENGGLTWAESGQIPANKNVLDNDEYKKLPYRGNYMDELEKAVLPSKNPHFYAMKDGMIQSLDAIWTGSEDVESGIDNLYDELSSNLD
ncbi:ABC transporter substrate-binding protein [Blautia sp. MSJ-36]|uniref:ABC transporter substrate-binding protein n=1 Tax=Blautia sp. MSJ-36 TaxID=2841530 RepID=UPI001C10F2FF|nr:ABC transporter substrate-binding protein [Blautia sp. MSJ-36]MBU5448299.1 ABC transporter substrate-binding protein [Blautia sp. MSJ-36]